MKKKLLVLSILGVLLFGVFLTISFKGLCSFSYICDRAHDDSMVYVFFLFIPLFIFSLITYKMREGIFESWWKFARIWIPLSMLAVIISPSYGNWMIPIEKGTVAFALSVLFVIISLVLIIWQSVKERRKES